MKEKYLIDDTGSNTILDIRAKARRLKAEVDDLDLIIIDYLQLMTAKKSKRKPTAGNFRKFPEISKYWQKNLVCLSCFIAVKSWIGKPR